MGMTVLTNLRWSTLIRHEISYRADMSQSSIADFSQMKDVWGSLYLCREYLTYVGNYDLYIGSELSNSLEERFYCLQ